MTDPRFAHEERQDALREIQRDQYLDYEDERAAWLAGQDEPETDIDNADELFERGYFD